MVLPVRQQGDYTVQPEGEGPQVPVRCKAFTPSHQRRKTVALWHGGSSWLWSVFCSGRWLITCATLKIARLGKKFCASTWNYWSSLYEKCGSNLLGWSLCSDTKGRIHL